MNLSHFVLTAFGVLAFSTWVNLNYTPENELYWPVLIASPLVIMLTFVTLTKTFSGILSLFRR